jgi:imidazolonepropionase-like amidohydrolase
VSTRPDTPARIVFTGANLLDGEHAARPGSTVVVEGDRIVSVADVDAGIGPEPSGDAPPDTRVVALGGRTLMPGMVSCHFHATYHELGSRPAPFGLEEPPALQAVRAVRNLERVLDAGFTSVVSAGAPHGIDAALRTAINEGAVNGPRVVPGSRDVSTTGHTNDSAPWYWDVRAPGALHLCDGPDEFAKAVRQEIREGARIIKTFITGGHGTVGPAERTEMTRAELAAAIEAAHGRGAQVRGHIANHDAIGMALDCGIDVVDHADGMDDHCIERLVESKTPVVPSLFFPYRLWSALRGQRLGFTDSLRQDIDRALEVLPRANAAGVTLVLGDDYGATGFPHGIYGEELAFYVDVVGIPPLDVLRWATRHGAELMGRGDELGSVAPGFLADLVVVDGDPSTDPGVLSDPANVVAVLKGGTFVKGAGAGGAPD